MRVWQAADSDETVSSELILQRTAAQRRKMLAIVLPLALLGGGAIWGAFALSGPGLLLMIVGCLLFGPMMAVLDQGWVEVRLTPAGFVIRRAGSRLMVPWDEVECFNTRTVPGLFVSGKVFGSGKVVSVTFREQRPTFPINRRALVGYLGSVGMSPEAEVELLERWRRRWSRPAS